MIKTWIRGLFLLRFPEIVEHLGERRFHSQQIQALKAINPRAKINHNVLIRGYRDGLLKLGDKSTLEAGTIMCFSDGSKEGGHISIGSNTWIGEYNNLRAGRGNITIGSNCLISQFCTLVACNHGIAREQPIISQQPTAYASALVLEDDVWLGAGAIITPGVTIEQGAVIGAGAVVTESVSRYEVWAGVPARKISNRR